MAPITLYRQLLPPPLLADYVRYFWVAEGPEISTPYHFSSVATGLAQLTFQYQGSFFSSCFAETEAETTFADHEHEVAPEAVCISQGILGAALYPYTAHLLFQSSETKISASISEEPKAVRYGLRIMEEQMQTAACHDERLALLENFLAQYLLPLPPRQDQLLPLIKADIDAGRVTNVERLLEQMHLSRRQFERRFKALMGQSPREYTKMQRFRNALQQFQHNPSQSFTQLALNSGYYDQAHFNRDFKEIAGVTPSEYFSDDLVQGLPL